FAGSPMQSAAKITSLPSAACSGATNWRSEKAGAGLPSGRPKCEITTTLAPFATSSSIVGARRSIRVASVTRPSLTGTFKSARSNTRLPPTSRSSRVRKFAIGFFLPWLPAHFHQSIAHRLARHHEDSAERRVEVEDHVDHRGDRQRTQEDSAIRQEVARSAQAKAGEDDDEPEGEDEKKRFRDRAVRLLDQLPARPHHQLVLAEHSDVEAPMHAILGVEPAEVAFEAGEHVP